MSNPPTPPVLRASKLLGLTALLLAAAGTLCVCLPATRVLGWVLLAVALILAVTLLVRRTRSRGLASAATALAAVGGLLGALLIPGGAPDTVEPTATSTATARSAPTDEPVPDAAEDAETVVAGYDFGESSTVGGGLVLTLDAPTEFSPSDAATGTGTGTPMTFAITVTNGTDAPYFPATFYMVVTSAEAKAPVIYDGDATNAPAGAILPGASTHFTLAFAITDPDSVVALVNPSVTDVEVDAVRYTLPSAR